MIVTKRLVLRGRSLGGYVRDALAAEAVALGLAGWTRARSDGTVEAIVQGDDQLVSTLIDWGTRGPAGSSVVAVDIGDAEGDFRGFEVRPEA
jgi:acylphosphatase